MILKNAMVISENVNDFWDLKIEDGIIIDIAKNLNGENQIDCSGLTILPAFVEMHCHLREPGFENKETIETGITSAIQGGYGAICPMPNTKPVTDNTKTLEFVLSKGNQIGLYPICAMTKNLEGKELTDLIGLKSAGAIAFSDDGKPFFNLALLKAALKIAKKNDLLLISHAEDTNYAPDDNRSEYEAVKAEIELVKKTGARYHFAHISTQESVELIRQAKKSGLAITCETAPHYFSLTKEDIKNNEARFKMNPPLRSQEDLNAIIEGLKDGTIDAIATDHAPHTIEEKNLPFDKSPMGIVGFETAFSLCFTNLVEAGHLNLSQLVEKLSSNPAKILGLKNYAQVKIGAPANLAIVDTNAKITVNAPAFKSKCKISPFDKMELKGKVVNTIIKGKIYAN